MTDVLGNFWGLDLHASQLVRVDTFTLELQQWPLPDRAGYSLTIDELGRPFVCGSGRIARFDVEQGEFSVRDHGQLGSNGCAYDGRGDVIWAAGGVDGGTPGLHMIDVESLGLLGSFDVGPTKGVDVDIDGRVWGVGGDGSYGAGGNGDTVVRLETQTGEVRTYTGLSGAYGLNAMVGYRLRQLP